MQCLLLLTLERPSLVLEIGLEEEASFDFRLEPLARIAMEREFIESSLLLLAIFNVSLLLLLSSLVVEDDFNELDTILLQLIGLRPKGLH